MYEKSYVFILLGYICRYHSLEKLLGSNFLSFSNVWSKDVYSKIKNWII